MTVERGSSMPINLDPTPERITAAKRAQSREWTFGPEGAGEIMTNETLGEMVVAGLIEPRFATAHQQISGKSDYLGLTARGEEWLARADQDATDDRPKETPGGADHA